VVCGFLMKESLKNMLKVWKKSWEPFGSCLLNSTANQAKLEWKWAGLAVLFSRQLPNGSHDFFQTFSISFLNYFIKNPQTTIALPFLTQNVSATGGVSAVLRVYLLGICQQDFQLDIWFKRVPKAHSGIPKHPKVSYSIPKFYWQLSSNSKKSSNGN